MPEKATVLMPVYNAEPYLKAAIQSILDQSFTDYCFLIINDGSTDGSEDVIKSFSDTRIKYFKHESNRGLIFTLNEGFKLATGEYIIRMDADDISLPERLKKQVKFMDANSDIAISGTYLAADNKEGVITFPQTNEECKVALLQNTIIGHPSAILRKKAIVKAELKFDNTALHAEDYRFWVDAAVAGLKVGNIPEPLVKYRLHEGQVSSKASAKQQESVQHIRLLYASYYFGSIVKNTGVYFNLLEKIINTFADFKTAIGMVESMKMENLQKQYFDSQLFDNLLNELLQSAAFRMYVLCIDCDIRVMWQAFFDRNFYKSTNFLQKGRFIFRSFQNAF